MTPEQVGSTAPSQIDRSNIPEGNFASDGFIDSYLPLSAEQKQLKEMWFRYRYERIKTGTLSTETLTDAWNDYQVIAKQWLKTQIELGLNEFGVGKPRMMPSYYFVVNQSEDGQIAVAPLNTFEFVNLADSFLTHDERVGEGIGKIYQASLTAQEGTGMARVSGLELYQQYKSLTDVIEFYRVIGRDAGRSIVEGRYVLVGRQLSTQERAFVHNYLQLNGSRPQAQEVPVPLDSVITDSDGPLTTTADNLIKNPAKFRYSDNGQDSISSMVARLNRSFEQRFSQALIEHNGIEMYQIIARKMDEVIDELFEVTFNGNNDRYRSIVGNLLAELQMIWASVNRPEVEPIEHLRQVYLGFYRMPFAHATTGENLWNFGNPITNTWYYGDACGGASIEVGKKCKKCDKKYTGEYCHRCRRSQVAA